MLLRLQSSVLAVSAAFPAWFIPGDVAQGLLQLGSGVNARDKAGATPLFVACESGHAACAKLLLHAGADVLLRNSAGEAPLYIAALRGEIVVVDALLQHMHEQGIRWQVQPFPFPSPPPLTLFASELV